MRQITGEIEQAGQTGRDKIDLKSQIKTLLTITSEGQHLKFLRCFLLLSDLRGAQLYLVSIYTFRTCKAQ